MIRDGLRITYLGLPGTVTEIQKDQINASRKAKDISQTKDNDEEVSQDAIADSLIETYGEVVPYANDEGVGVAGRGKFRSLQQAHQKGHDAETGSRVRAPLRRSPKVRRKKLQRRD